MLRVIAGKARRLQLVTPRGDATRPTTDRIKETLFNILAPELAGVRFLDLFAGCGAIGIEALSRGAAEAVFSERDREALGCIRRNLATTRLTDVSRVIDGDVYAALRRLEAEGRPFDIIFMDPPYGAGHYEKVLGMLSGGAVAGADTLIIAEADKSEDFAFAADLGLAVVREKIYKTNKHVFLKRKTEEEK